MWALSIFYQALSIQSIVLLPFQHLSTNFTMTHILTHILMAHCDLCNASRMLIDVLVVIFQTSPPPPCDHSYDRVICATQADSWRPPPGFSPWPSLPPGWPLSSSRRLRVLEFEYRFNAMWYYKTTANNLTLNSHNFCATNIWQRPHGLSPLLSISLALKKRYSYIVSLDSFLVNLAYKGNIWHFWFLTTEFDNYWLNYDIYNL